MSQQSSRSSDIVADDPPRASSAWREGDPPGRRQWVDTGPQRLELGGLLPAVRVAYETWGTPRRDGSGAVVNAALVLPALTADSHVSGPAQPGHPTPGWWDGLVGAGRALDTGPGGWWVLASNVLGGCQGTTGPASPGPGGRAWGSRFPALTVRDQVEVERRLADLLGIARFGLVMGGSMGGMRALEWAATHPERVARLGLVATTAASSADQLGLQTTQLHAVRADPGWRGGDYHDAPPGHGPHTGLGIARRVAHLSYRSAVELDQRFGRQAQAGEDPLRGGRWAVQSYLDHQAEKLIRRFDAGSYVVLTEAMSSHDVGRGRGGVAPALTRVTAQTVVVGLDTDRLYPLAQQAELVAGIPGAAPLAIVCSPYGHDGFLLETDQVGTAFAPLLSPPR